MYQPYYPNQFQMNQFNQNIQQILKVNGENGAKSIPLQFNSSVLALDETAPIVWLISTDSVGLKNVVPYKIEPITPEAQQDNYKELSERISRLEEKINDKSNITNDSKWTKNK